MSLPNCSLIFYFAAFSIYEIRTKNRYKLWNATKTYEYVSMCMICSEYARLVIRHSSWMSFEREMKNVRIKVWIVNARASTWVRWRNTIQYNILRFFSPLLGSTRYISMISETLSLSMYELGWFTLCFGLDFQKFQRWSDLSSEVSSYLHPNTQSIRSYVQYIIW